MQERLGGRDLSCFARSYSRNNILGYVGLTVLPPFVAFHVPYISAEARRDCLEQYRAHLLTLEQRAPLAFPSLDDFDDRLQPRVAAAS